LESSGFKTGELGGQEFGSPRPFQQSLSPDLNLLHFHLWGHLKSLVYSSVVNDVETLRNRIVTGFQATSKMPGIWDYLGMAVRRRATACVQAGCGHREYLM
jgi:hypothetical protein